MKRAPTGVGDSSRGLLLRDVLVGECLAGIDAVEVLDAGGAVGLLAQVVRDGHGDRVDLLEHLAEFVNAQAEHLPVLFLGEAGDTTNVVLVLTSTLPREVTRAYEVLPGFDLDRAEPGANHETQLAFDVLQGAVLGGGHGLITDVSDDHGEIQRVRPVAQERDDVVGVQDHQRHALFGEALAEHLGELTVEPVHEHLVDVHSKHIVQIHVVSILGFGSQVATKRHIIA